MTSFQASILALIQGVSEFLPISSSAHLILIPRLLGWEDQGLAFDVVVHLGTLTAVIYYYRQDIAQILQAWFAQFTLYRHTPQPIMCPKSKENAQLGNYILLATIPTGLVGLFGKDFIEAHLRTPLIIAGATAFFALLLALADWRSKYAQDKKALTYQAALLIGMSQVFALIPGTSRSGVTITAALLLGYSAKNAARFSFLLSIPIISLSGLLTLKSLIHTATPVEYLPLLIGFTLSASSAYLCIKFFIKSLAKISLLPYVLYRLILALLLLYLFV